MPFEPLTDDEKKQWPEPCSDPQHSPPTHIVITTAVKWVCPSCGRSVILRPNTVRMSCGDPQQQTSWSSDAHSR